MTARGTKLGPYKKQETLVINMTFVAEVFGLSRSAVTQSCRHRTIIDDFVIRACKFIKKNGKDALVAKINDVYNARAVRFDAPKNPFGRPIFMAETEHILNIVDVVAKDIEDDFNTLSRVFVFKKPDEDTK